MQIKLALRMLKEEGLIHYEASFCYDAFQFCVLVRAATSCPYRRAYTDPLDCAGLGLRERKGVDTARMGGLVHHVRPRQQRGAHVQGLQA